MPQSYTIGALAKAVGVPTSTLRYYERLGILKPDGSGERVLTQGFHNEGPTFAPNGRVLMFFRDVGQGPSLFTIDITGRNELKVPTPSYASDPAWSPLLS